MYWDFLFFLSPFIAFSALGGSSVALGGEESELTRHRHAGRVSGRAWGQGGSSLGPEEVVVLWGSGPRAAEVYGMVWRLVTHRGEYVCTAEKRFLQMGEEKARKNPEVVGWKRQYIFYLAEAG